MNNEYETPPSSPHKKHTKYKYTVNSADTKDIIKQKNIIKEIDEERKKLMNSEINTVDVGEQVNKLLELKEGIKGKYGIPDSDSETSSEHRLYDVGSNKSDSPIGGKSRTRRRRRVRRRVRRRKTNKKKTRKAKKKTHKKKRKGNKKRKTRSRTRRKH